MGPVGPVLFEGFLVGRTCCLCSGGWTWVLSI